MGKKKEIKVNGYSNEMWEENFKTAFFTAFEYDGLSINGNDFQIETDDEIYVVDLKIFADKWMPALVNLYDKYISQALEMTKADPEIIRLIYRWINPVFDNFPNKIESRDAFIKEFKEKLETDSNYFTTVRLAAIEKMEDLDWESIVSYIDRFIPYGVAIEEDKVQFGYYAGRSPEELKQIFEEKNFTKDDIVEVVSQAFAFESEKQEYSRSRGRKVNNNRRVKILNLLPPDEIIDTYIHDIISDEEFFKTKVTKQDLFEIQYDMLIKIMSDKNAKLPSRLKITSKDLINQYGRTLTGAAIYDLTENGWILPEDLIEVYEINKALVMTELEEYILENEELELFYTPEVLLDMKEKGKLTPRFLRSYLEMEDFENNPENFKAKSEILVEEQEKRSKEQKDDRFEDRVLELFDIGLCDSETAKSKVSEEYIEEKFLNDELTVDQIFEYYKKELIGEEAVLKYYSKQELFELYESGKVSRDCLRAIKDVDFLLQKFCDGRIADSDFLRLYLEAETLSVTDLEEGLGIAGKEVDIFGFIDEKTPFSKIKELYMSYLIDYSTILRLHNQGVIDKEQLEELKSALDTKKFFEEIGFGKVYKVVTTRENDRTSRKPSGSRENVEKDYTDELRLISELLEKDVESEAYSVIESYNAKGRVTSLNNYRIFGNQELDGIVILQKSKKENAVYVMSAPQMMYFLHGKENEEGQIEIQNRMKDKAYLKTIEGVEVVEHTEYFARNLVEAASRISPRIAERTKIKNDKYVKEVDEMVKAMREKYLEEKARGRDED